MKPASVDRADRGPPLGLDRLSEFRTLLLRHRLGVVFLLNQGLSTTERIIMNSKSSSGGFVLLCTVALALAHSSSFSAEVKAPAGFTPLFNGKDLTGWYG